MIVYSKEYLAQFGNPESRLRALHEIPSDENFLIEILILALEDPYARIRFRAGEGLAEVAQEKRIRDLFTEESSENLKQAAMLAFRKPTVEKETEALVLYYAKSTHASIRYHALLSLHAFAKDETLKEVTTFVFEHGDEDAIIVGAQWAAMKGWDLFKEHINTHFLESRSKEFRFQLAVAFSKLINDENSLPAEMKTQIIDALLDDKISMTASQVVAKLRIKDALKNLKKVQRKVLMHELLKVEAAATRAVLEDPEGHKLFGKYILDKREHVSSYASECAGRYLLPFKNELQRAAMINDDRKLAAENALPKLQDR